MVVGRGRCLNSLLYKYKLLWMVFTKKNYTTRCFDEAAAVDDDDVDDSKAEGAGRF